MLSTPGGPGHDDPVQEGRMPESNSTIRVAVYARKSTPKQEDSIGRQLAQV